MRIGLLLGSFDPIHIGHVHIATTVLNEKVCDKVLFVVAKQNPFKEKQPSPFDIRCGMIEASIRGLEDKCEVCRLEENIEGKSYSYKVLNLLREKYPKDELFIVCGMDTFKILPKWKNYDTDIKPYFGVIVLDRDEQMEDEETVIPSSVIAIQPLPICISSTFVRFRIKNGEIPIPYINKETYDIILKNKLYGIQ